MACGLFDLSNTEGKPSIQCHVTLVWPCIYLRRNGDGSWWLHLGTELVYIPISLPMFLHIQAYPWRSVKRFYTWKSEMPSVSCPLSTKWQHQSCQIVMISASLDQYDHPVDQSCIFFVCDVYNRLLPFVVVDKWGAYDKAKLTPMHARSTVLLCVNGKLGNGLRWSYKAFASSRLSMDVLTLCFFW